MVFRKLQASLLPSHLRLSDSFDLTLYALWQILYCDAASCRLGCEILSVNFIESSKVRHVCQEACGLDHLIKSGTGFFKKSAYIFAALGGLLSDGLRNISCSRVYRDLTRCEYESAGNKAL